MWENILAAANKFLQGIGISNPNTYAENITPINNTPANNSPAAQGYGVTKPIPVFHPQAVNPDGSPYTNSNSTPQIVAPSMPASTYKPVSQQTYGRIPQTNSMNIDPGVVKAIEGAAQHYGIPKNLLYDIGFSESSLDPSKQPNELNHAGLFQFDPALWQTVMNYSKMPNNTVYIPNPNANYMDPANAAYATAYLIKNGQLGRWDASDWNWGQQYTPQELEKLGFYSQDTTHTPGKFYYQVAGGKK